MFKKTYSIQNYVMFDLLWLNSSLRSTGGLEKDVLIISEWWWACIFKSYFYFYLFVFSKCPRRIKWQKCHWRTAITTKKTGSIPLGGCQVERVWRSPVRDFFGGGQAPAEMGPNPASLSPVIAIILCQTSALLRDHFNFSGQITLKKN